MQWEPGKEKEAGPREKQEGGSQDGRRSPLGRSNTRRPSGCPESPGPVVERELTPGRPEEATGSRLHLGALPGSVLHGVLWAWEHFEVSNKILPLALHSMESRDSHLKM